MKVILLEKVPHVGNVGEIVKVTPGFGRNYLIPKKFAVIADERNKSLLENQKKRLQKKVDAEKAGALKVKQLIDGLSIELVKRVGSNGKLFGSVTNTELAKIIQEMKGVEVERRLIVVDNPIKSTGTFQVSIKLFRDVEAKFKVKVAMDPEQIEELRKRQEQAEKRAKQKQEAAASGEGDNSLEINTAAETADEGSESDLNE